MRFAGGRLPLAGPGGYWSLTMYDEHSLLVANPIDRYATRPERPGFVRDPDGGATITLAPALPGGVPEANWLPARPAGSGSACGSTTPVRQSPTAPGPRPR